jgi:hypothetical protein
MPFRRVYKAEQPEGFRRGGGRRQDVLRVIFSGNVNRDALAGGGFYDVAPAADFLAGFG